MQASDNERSVGHKGWVKITHWFVALSFLFLLFTGIEILMVHPRLYWGEVGNDLTPALFELPISRNYKHGGWTESQPFSNMQNAPVSAGRTYEIFNENGWGRSLHFLSGWFLVAAGLVYLLFGIFTGHFRKHIIPGRTDRSWSLFLRDVRDHFRLNMQQASVGSQYGLLQKTTYAGVVFIALPLMVITGFTMAPAITNAFPFLLKLFGGYQSARTIHFFSTIALTLFLLVHVVMVIRTGFKKQMLSMTIRKYEKEDHNKA
jgi:thiosulfate reductase cytochrome b subunit